MAYILKQLAGTDWLKDFNPPEGGPEGGEHLQGSSGGAVCP